MLTPKVVVMVRGSRYFGIGLPARYVGHLMALVPRWLASKHYYWWCWRCVYTAVPVVGWPSEAKWAKYQKTSLRQMQGGFGIFLRLWVEDKINKEVILTKLHNVRNDSKFGLRVNLVGYV